MKYVNVFTQIIVDDLKTREREQEEEAIANSTPSFSEKMIDKFWAAMDTQCHNLLVAVPKLEVTLENVVVCQNQPTCVSLGSYSEEKRNGKLL